jgi:regulator of sigma E protease
MFIVLALLALALLIIVHEGGHYLVAKWCGMRVERFSIGFGPALVTKVHKGTKFQIAPIPIGGFVQITGMNPHEDYDENDPSVYPNRPAILRFLTILAGPLTNILFSTVFVFCVFVFAGVEVPTGIRVDDVTPDSASVGKLASGDVLDQVDGQPTRNYTEFRKRIQEAKGKPVNVTVIRDGKPVTVEITPRLENGAYLVGAKLAPIVQRQKLGLGKSIVESARYPIVMSGMILSGLWEIVTGRAPADVIGPVGMVAMISDTVKAGWVRAFELLALLNVYLGLFNLLPLPALDGGRLVFLGYELVTRRRPNPRVEATVHTFGFIVLFAVMILVVFKDIFRLFK